MNYGQRVVELLRELKRSDWLPSYNEESVRATLQEINLHTAELQDIVRANNRVGNKNNNSSSTGGGGGAPVTVTDAVRVQLRRFASVTVRLAVKLPAVAYVTVADAVAAVAGVPPWKAQRYA